MQAILTGASRGIGLHIARALAREGIDLALVALPAEAELLDTVAGEMRSLGVEAVAIAADVTEENARQRIVERAREELGPIDILVNNAGIEPLGHFVRQPEAEITRAIETNLTAPLQLAKLVLPEMLERGSGHIVTISSLVARKGTAYAAAYSASKAGLDVWSEAMRAELVGRGIGFSVVSPGYVFEAGVLAEVGHPPPQLLRVKPERVARAVVRALRENRSEQFVAPGSVRSLLVLNALSPSLGTALLGWLGTVRFHRVLADGREAARSLVKDGANEAKA